MRPLGPRRIKKKKRGSRAFGPAPTYGDSSFNDSSRQIDDNRLNKIGSTTSGQTSSYLVSPRDTTDSYTSKLHSSSTANSRILPGMQSRSVSQPAKAAFSSPITQQSKPYHENSSSSGSGSQTIHIRAHSADDPMRVYMFTSNDRQAGETSTCICICLAKKSQRDLVYSQWKEGSSPASAFTFDEKHCSGTEVSVRLLGPLFEDHFEDVSSSSLATSENIVRKPSNVDDSKKKSKRTKKKKCGFLIKFWWVEGRPCWKTISVQAASSYLPFDFRSSVLVSRQGEAYCQRIFHMTLKQHKPEYGKAESHSLIITSASEDVFPFSMHRDCDIPVCSRSFDPRPGHVYDHKEGEDCRLTSSDLLYAQVCAERFERSCGKYALIIATNGMDRSLRKHVVNAAKLERVLHDLGYAITRIIGADATQDNILTSLRTMIRPPEPPSRGMGRGGWWAGGSASASALVFISMDNVPGTGHTASNSPMIDEMGASGLSGLQCVDRKVLYFHQVRKALISGGRAQRPYYLQGYEKINTNSKKYRQKVVSKSARILCIVDGSLDASEDAELRGHQTLIQHGSHTQRSECDRPMESSEVTSVQMLLMPYLSTAANDDVQSKMAEPGEDSLYTSILINGLKNKLFRKTKQWMASKRRVDSISAGMLVQYLELQAMIHIKNHRLHISLPKLYHLYPGTISHPDVTNRKLQFHFYRSWKHQQRLNRARYMKVLKNNALERSLQVQASAKHLAFLNKKLSTQLALKKELQISLSKLDLSVSPVTAPGTKLTMRNKQSSPRSRKLLFKHSRNRPPGPGAVPGRRQGPLKRTAFISDINGRRIKSPKRPHSASRMHRTSRIVNRPSSAHTRKHVSENRHR